MKKSVRPFSYLAELILIGFGIAFFFSPHFKTYTYYFPVAIVTVLIIIQLIIRKDVFGLALGLLTAPVFLLIIIVMTLRTYKYTRMLGESFGVYVSHVSVLLICLIASIWLIRKYLLLHYHSSGKQTD